MARTFCSAELEVGLVENPVPGDLAPLDVFVVQADPCAPGETIACEVWGALRVVYKGQADWKIIAYPAGAKPPNEWDIMPLWNWLKDVYFLKGGNSYVEDRIYDRVFALKVCEKAAAR